MTGAVHEQDGFPEVSVSVVLPEELASVAESAGWGVTTEELPAGHVVVTSEAVCDPRTTKHLEAMLLAAYNYAMSRRCALAASETVSAHGD